MVQIIPPKRMELWFAHLRKNTSTSVQEGDRPVLIVSNDVSNHYSNLVTVIPLTSQMKKLEQPTHHVIRGLLAEDSLILAEQITTVSKKCLERRVGVCKDPETIKHIETAIKIHLGLEDKTHE